ncbi:MAG: TonB family protein [Crocinitomicaceae bacterium]
MKTIVVLIALFSLTASLANEGIPKKRNTISSWLTENAVYPSAAVESREEGTVYLSFEIINGQVQNIVVLEGVSKVLDEAAIEMVKKIPASELQEDAETEKNKYIIPIKFEIK